MKLLKGCISDTTLPHQKHADESNQRRFNLCRHHLRFFDAISPDELDSPRSVYAVSVENPQNLQALLRHDGSARHGRFVDYAAMRAGKLHSDDFIEVASCGARPVFLIVTRPSVDCLKKCRISTERGTCKMATERFSRIAKTDCLKAHTYRFDICTVLNADSLL